MSRQQLSAILITQSRILARAAFVSTYMAEIVRIIETVVMQTECYDSYNQYCPSNTVRRYFNQLLM